MKDLFADNLPTPPEKQCVICDLELDENVSDLPGNEGKVHTACLEHRIASGEYSPESVLSMEKSASKHDLIIHHPAVGDRGCVVCGGGLQDSDLIVSTKPEVTMCHAACIKSFIDNETPTHVLVMVAKLNGMRWDTLVNGTIKCAYCNGVVSHNPVIAGQSIFHSPCFAIKYASGAIAPEAAEVALAENKLTHEGLLQVAKAWKNLQAVASMKREAEGMVSSLWAKFKGWLSGIWDNLTGVNEAYDTAIAATNSIASSATTASVTKEAITPEVQQAMDLLKELEDAEKARQTRVAEILRSRQITNLKQATDEATAKVVAYIESLSSKQRKYQEALFRLKEVKHRGTFKTTEFRQAIHAMFAADAEMTSRVSALEAQFTKAGFTDKQLEILLSEPEVHPSTERLHETGVPAEQPPVAPPSETPRTTSSLEESLFGSEL